MGIPRLLTYFLRTIKPRNGIKQHSFLLNLPIELLYEIFEQLALPEKLLFSQTCRDLWRLLRHKCSLTFEKADGPTRRYCLYALGDILPDHRYCFDCRALHLLNPNDIIFRGWDEYPKSYTSSMFEDWHFMSPCYALAFRHVQLAIKYTRLRNFHQDYLSSIMQTFTKTMLHHSMRLKFTAEPVVIDGRFLLMASFTFYEITTPMSSSTLLESHFGLCPHLTVCEPLLPTKPLVALINSAFVNPPSSRTSYHGLRSCDYCPTDYSLIIGDKRATFSTWQDLGAGASPTDPYWSSHVSTDTNNPYTCTKFEYEHGSIKALYVSRSTRSKRIGEMSMGDHLPIWEYSQV